MELFNLMEQLVEDHLERALKDMPDVCPCELCKMDIMAIVLNNVKPKYVVTQKGYVFSKSQDLNYQFSIDLIKEIAQAAQIVAKNPRHEKL